MSDATRPDVTAANAREIVRLREVLRIVLYFNKPHQSISPEIRKVIVDFVDLVTVAAFGYFYGMDGEAEEFSAESFSDLMDSWFLGPYSGWPNATIELDGHDYTAPEYGLRYWGKALDDPGFPEDAGFLNLWVPRSFFLKNQEAISSYFRSALAQVPVCSAYLSLGLSGGDKRGKQSLARRYYGLDIANPESISIDLGTKCPGSYWVTYLGPELSAGLGGQKAVEVSLEQSSSVEELPDAGLLVQLTDEPELGDRNRREILLSNVAFARFLNAKGYLHIPRKSVYFEDERGFADLEEQEAWHRRFLLEDQR